LEEIAPGVSHTVVRHHPRSADRNEFVKYISEVKSIFEDWRYTYEKEFLIGWPDDLLEIANAFRDTIKEIPPQLPSVFHNIS
jgi:hypothetical protein